MSLITRCPVCATMYKVVPDQLRISGGWVRCGHCSEVFDAPAQMLTYDESVRLQLAPAVTSTPAPEAALHAPADAAPPPPPRGAAGALPPAWTPPVSWQTLMRPEASPPEAATALPASQPGRAAPAWPQVWRSRFGASAGAAVPTAGTEVEVPPDDADTPVQPGLAGTAAESPPQPPPQPVAERTAAGPGGDTVDAAGQAAPAEQAADPAAEEPLADVGPARAPASEAPGARTDADPADASAAAALDAPAAPIDETAPMPLASDAEADEPAVDGRVAEPEPTDVVATAQHAPAAPSFVAQARRRAFWSSRPVRAALWMLLCLLALGLALQLVLSRRDWLAARQPALAPALQMLCQPWGCGIRPYRLPDAIVIESSTFMRTGANSFRFSVTLRNSADLPVAAPALELTLTDTQEQVLLRRVLSAAELGAPPALAARGEFSGNHTLTVDDSANPAAIVGFRLLAFYP